MSTFFISLWNIALEMAPYLLFGFIVAGVLHAFVPQRIFKEHLARPGIGSVLKATLLGIPLPLCSCGVIPTTVSLKKSGASAGACTAFLIATPQTGVDSILATYSLLGLPFAVIRPVAALVTALIGGAITPVLTRSKGEASVAPMAGVSGCKADDDASSSLAGTFTSRLVETFRYAFGELLEDVGRWLVIGLLIAALITAFVPDGFFLSLRAYPLLNMLVVLAVAIPMYVCATGSIPIAMALMAAGMSPGSALVLLMAGPAVNAASLLVVGKALGRPNMVAYLMSVVIGAIGFGLLIDYVLPPEWFDVSARGLDLCCAHNDISLWKVGACILFLVLLVRALWNRQHGHISCHCAEGESSCAADETLVLHVTGMRCSHCSAAVERAVSEVQGVEAVAIDLPTGNVSITGEHLDVAALRAAIENVGYKVED